MSSPDSRDRPAFPALVESIGEDPARVLYQRERWVAKARIRGIHTYEVLDAYRAVERNLARRADREPRDWVLAALDERKAHLEAHGEFDPDVDPPERDTSGYTPDQWQSSGPGGLPPITPHPENRVDPATDGGHDADENRGEWG